MFRQAHEYSKTKHLQQMARPVAVEQGRKPLGKLRASDLNARAQRHKQQKNQQNQMQQHNNKLPDFDDDQFYIPAARVMAVPNIQRKLFY
jgi:hypothetical protein